MYKNSPKKKEKERERESDDATSLRREEFGVKRLAQGSPNFFL